MNPTITITGRNERVTWWAVGGKGYFVQFTTNLAGGSAFSDISPQIQVPVGAGEATTNFLHMGGAIGFGSRFYRIRLGP